MLQYVADSETPRLSSVGGCSRCSKLRFRRLCTCLEMAWYECHVLSLFRTAWIWNDLVRNRNLGLCFELQQNEQPSESKLSKLQLVDGKALGMTGNDGNVKSRPIEVTAECFCKASMSTACGACGASTPCVDEYCPTGRLAKGMSLSLIAWTSLAPDRSLVTEDATVGCIQTVQHLPVPVASFTAFQHPVEEWSLRTGVQKPYKNCFRFNIAWALPPFLLASNIFKPQGSITSTLPSHMITHDCPT